MGKINNPQELAMQTAEEYKACYGADLISVILFGSAAGGDFNPEKSDINLLVILKNAGILEIEKSECVQKHGRKYRIQNPLFFDPAYIAGSLDSFPVEFLNMRENYKVLFGEDLLKNLEIKKEDLRLQVERELKGKELHLKKEWMQVKDHPRFLERLIGASLGDFAAVFRALLYLKGRKAPASRSAVFAVLEEAYGVSGCPISRIYGSFAARDKKSMRVIFPEYAAAIKHISDQIEKE